MSHDYDDRLHLQSPVKWEPRTGLASVHMPTTVPTMPTTIITTAPNDERASFTRA